MNYFTLFDMPVSLKVDQAALLKKYYALSKRYHPDNFTLSDVASQEESEQMTAKINEAKKILDSPYRRLEYILRQQQIIFDDEKYTLPAMFLGAMMDINEELMELEVAQDEIRSAAVRKLIEAMEDDVYGEVSSLFERNELVLSAHESSVLKDYYYKKKYLQRIRERLN
ncbi:MAG: Fe-S protein assembly co-chaperone HscB [Chitinophagaceae bacterium]|jgi:molecular chaperone HscB|nr:Fe-S protein assembly co-chaperone HscB [Chitinophagaceae bacterium]